LETDAVDVDAADDNSGDGVSDSVDEDDEVSDDDNDDDDEEVVSPAPGVRKPSNDIVSLKLQIQLAELTFAAHTSAIQIRLAVLNLKKRNFQPTRVPLQSPALSVALSLRFNSL